MGIFTKLLKKKKLGDTLTQHPIANLSDDVKKDYLQSLVVLATEDENFSDEEKDYIKMIIQASKLDDSLLDELETFANTPEESELIEFVSRLGDFDNDTKMSLLVDICIVAFKDGDFSSEEMELFDEYLDILGMQEHKQTLLYLADILNSKNIDNAVSFYTGQKEVFEKFKYMFDLLEIDPEEEVQKIYNYEWISWEISVGTTRNNKISSRPVSIRQYCVFLNSQIMNGILENIENTTRFKIDESPILDDANHTNLEFSNSIFAYTEETRDDAIVGIGHNGIRKFCDWSQEYGFNVDFMRFRSGATLFQKSDSYLHFGDTCIGKPDGLKEIFINTHNGDCSYYDSSHFGSSNNSSSFVLGLADALHSNETTVFSISKIKSSELSDFTFRVMHISSIKE